LSEQVKLGKSFADDFDASYGALVDKEMRTVRAAETSWQTPKACAQLKFDPDSDSLAPLKTGQNGTVSSQMIAKSDGGASPGKWNASATNGSITPTGQGTQPSFTYVAGSSTAGPKLIVRFKATSKAGVDEADWQQAIEPPAIKHIAGTISGSQQFQTGNGASVLSFAGNLAFDRSSPATGDPASGSYTVGSGDYTLTASGFDGSGITACHQTGSKHFVLPAGDGSVNVSGTAAPYDYSFSASLSPKSMTITRTGCPPADSSFEGTTYDGGLFSPFQTNDPHSSPDGIAYDGSESQQGGTLTLTWSFQGTP
jgi:hypothetical protein